MVRDLAREQKKHIRMEVSGGDLELDRGIIEEVGEILIHLLRNAVDHGIERPERRKNLGKPEEGKISISTTRIQNIAQIEVRDDGAGLDFEEIKKTAEKKGLISSDDSQEALEQVIFQGVSTATKVTSVSGRGFGLNIVKDKIDSKGGTVRISSTPNQGTVFTIGVPVTLAVIKALFVKVAGKLYAIPLANLVRLVSVRKREIKGMLNYQALVSGEENIPVTDLRVLFDGPAGENPSAEDEEQPMAIIRKGQEKMGLAVDGFSSTQEIVVKPLGHLIRKNKYVSGTTIIGSGEAALILDISNLILSRKKPVKVKAK